MGKLVGSLMLSTPGAGAAGDAASDARDAVFAGRIDILRRDFGAVERR